MRMFQAEMCQKRFQKAFENNLSVVRVVEKDNTV